MNKIKFVYIGEHSYNVHERPRPSSSFIPNWFKNMPPYDPTMSENGIKIVVEGESNATAKKCVPMLDAITTGYTVTLWSDVQVRQEEFGPRITWRVSKDVFSAHKNYGAQLIPPPIGYDNTVFKYLTNFRVETPSGYSIIIRPPAGYYDLPFYAVPAIIDSDKSVIDTNIPVWIKSGIDCIVEKGTPIAQIIPFKRENWQSDFSYIDEQEFSQQVDKNFLSTIKNNYIKNIWSKKKFI